MKSIAHKFSNPHTFEQGLESQLENLRQVESVLEIQNQKSPNDALTTVPISYLVNQHKKEILDTNSDYNQVLKLSFNTEF
jgi:hypothetical protein